MNRLHELARLSGVDLLIAVPVALVMAAIAGLVVDGLL